MKWTNGIQEKRFKNKEIIERDLERKFMCKHVFTSQILILCMVLTTKLVMQFTEFIKTKFHAYNMNCNIPKCLQ